MANWWSASLTWKAQGARCAGVRGYRFIDAGDRRGNAVFLFFLSPPARSAAKKPGKAGRSSLQTASKEPATLQGNDQAASNSHNNERNANNAEFVPIDGQITLMDAFVDSPAMKGHIDKANQNIAKGDSKAAMDELKLADVGATFTRVLIPLQQTRDHVEAAGKPVEQKKFYEANLALKAAEDRMPIDSVMLTEPTKSSPDSTTGKATAPSNRTSSGKTAG